MKDKNKAKNWRALRRQRRTRARIIGTATKPRVSVFRSLTHIYVQAIDDISKRTLAAAADKELKNVKGNKTDLAAKVGEAMGQKLKDKKISEIIFDKGAYKYHGRVKSLADGIRKAGINF